MADTPTGRRYAQLNTGWPDPLPPLTEQEAISAAKRLYRLGTGTAFKGTIKATSGNRHTYIRRGVLWVNPTQGWPRLVHAMSHVAHERLHPGKPPHHWLHVDLERRLVAATIERGWLDGALRRAAKPTPDIRAVRRQRILARIQAWESKRKRAETALKKLYRQRAYYDR